MAKSRKKAAAPEAPIVPRVGDKVTIPKASSVLEVDQVSLDGTEVTLRTSRNQPPMVSRPNRHAHLRRPQAAGKYLQPVHHS